MDGEHFKVCLRSCSRAAITTCLPAHSQLYCVSERGSATRMPIFIAHEAAHRYRTRDEGFARGYGLARHIRRAYVPSTTDYCDADSRDNDKRKLHFPRDWDCSQSASGRRPRPKQQYSSNPLAVSKDRIAKCRFTASFLSPCKLRSNGAWKPLARWREKRGEVEI
jgi:hypothetical protein